MNELILNLKEFNFLPKEKISFDVSWQLDNIPKKIEVRLFWYTKGKGTEDSCVAETCIVDHLSDRGNKSVYFTLPESPYSFSGKLISLNWAIEFVVKSPDKCIRKEIVISPIKIPIKLY